jgi:hypothetical protein
VRLYFPEVSKVHAEILFDMMTGEVRESGLGPAVCMLADPSGNPAGAWQQRRASLAVWKFGHNVQTAVDNQTARQGHLHDPEANV